MKKNWVKHLLQLGVLGLIILFFIKPYFGFAPADVEAYCPFGGFQALMAYLELNSLACSMTFVQIMMGAFLFIIVIHFGKLFCGYLCPLGTITEYLGRLRKPLGINWEIKTASIADRALRSIKYMLMGCIFYVTIGTSELFCKKFDPYYALATGFQGEIVLWMSIVSIAVFVLGSIFIKMFWCKYVCPLGALSNVFRFTFSFLGVFIIFRLLHIIGFDISLRYLFIAAAVVAYISEIVYYRTTDKYLPLIKVTRDTETCNNCGICRKKCPMSIPVDQLTEVREIDCTLCEDCIAACPKKSLKINKKDALRWLPGIVLVVSFVLALIIGSQWEIPTIDERWGDYQERELETVEMEGIKSVKCYGSSKAFSAKMKNTDGVYGATAYAKTNRVIVYFDPSEINREKVQEVIFEPTKIWLNEPPYGIDTVKIMTLGVEGLFDKEDVDNLSILLLDNENFYAIQSEYDCPVIVKLFMNKNYEINKKELARLIEVKVYEIPFDDGIFELECNYELVTVSKDVEFISGQDFFDLMFTQKGDLLKNISKYENQDYLTYVVPVGNMSISDLESGLAYLYSHVSNFNGIAGWGVTFESAYPYIRINYMPEIISEDEVRAMLNQPVWTIYWSEEEKEDIDAMLVFEEKGKTIKPE